MIPRLSSGLARLDAVLGGGLPSDAITLIAGEPGTGKTILAHHFALNNATPPRPALYCSTVSEPLEKMLRYVQTLDFFDPGAIGNKVFIEDIGSVAASSDSFDAVLAHLDMLIRKHRPALLVLDSFKALREFAPSPAAYRRFVYALAGRLSAQPVSSFFLGEYTSSEPANAPEFAVADIILSLTARREDYRTSWFLEVLKMRGASYTAGSHAYRITEGGLQVFPRVADPFDMAVYELGEQRVSSGIAALDELLHDGYWAGASILVAGPTGSGKTLMGLQFLHDGALRGEAGILATLQESPTQLARIAKGFGWTIESAGIQLYGRSPVGLLIDEWLYGVLDTAAQSGARRLVVDSLGDLMIAAGDEVRFREYMYSLVQRCARLQMSVLMTHEVPQLFGVSEFSELGIAHLCDNVVLLQYLPSDDRLRRAITVLKTRAGGHEPFRHEYEITSNGVELVQPADPPVDLPARR